MRKKSLHGMPGVSQHFASAQGLEEQKSTLGKGLLAPLLWSRERQECHLQKMLHFKEGGEEIIWCGE